MPQADHPHTTTRRDALRIVAGTAIGGYALPTAMLADPLLTLIERRAREIAHHETADVPDEESDQLYWIYARTEREMMGVPAESAEGARRALEIVAEHFREEIRSTLDAGRLPYHWDKFMLSLTESAMAFLGGQSVGT